MVNNPLKIERVPKTKFRELPGYKSGALVRAVSSLLFPFSKNQKNASIGGYSTSNFRFLSSLFISSSPLFFSLAGHLLGFISLRKDFAETRGS